MKVGIRYIIDESNLTASNLAEDDAPEWDAETNYLAGDEVRVTEFHRVYVSAIDDNLGNKPPEDGDPTDANPQRWILKSATNKFAAFDDYVANKAENTGTITYSITATSPVTTVVFFGLEATSVSVAARNGVTLQNYSKDLLSYSHIDGSLWNWLTGGRPRASEAVFLNVAYFGPGTVYEITIDGAGGTARVGQIVIGSDFDAGITHSEPTLRRRSFDILTEDEFGNVRNTRRLSARLMDITSTKRSEDVRRTDQVLDQIRGTFTFFIGSEVAERGLILFGYLQDYDITPKTKALHTIRLNVRGLI